MPGDVHLALFRMVQALRVLVSLSEAILLELLEEKEALVEKRALRHDIQGDS